MKKVLFIDRDGTLICEPPDFQIDAFEKLQFLPQVLTFLGKIVGELGFELVMVTNQDGLGTPAFPEETFLAVHRLLMQIFENEGIVFSEVCIDRSFAIENKPTRKPEIGMTRNIFPQNTIWQILLSSATAKPTCSSRAISAQKRFSSEIRTSI